jgi:hypothetical protein
VSRALPVQGFAVRALADGGSPRMLSTCTRQIATCPIHRHHRRHISRRRGAGIQHDDGIGHLAVTLQSREAP